MRNSEVKKAAASECCRRAMKADSRAPETVRLTIPLDASGIGTIQRSSHERKDWSRNWNIKKGSVALGRGQSPVGIRGIDEVWSEKI